MKMRSKKMYKIKGKVDNKIVGYMSGILKEYKKIFKNLAK